jgi:uncharacterized repeat protein (TIGR03803 family)
MKKSRLATSACILFVILFATVLKSPAQTYSVSFTFNGDDGAYPESPLIGAFVGGSSNEYVFSYGTTFSGGVAGPCGQQWGCGTIATNQYSFACFENCPNGVLPTGGLVQASNGSLYGTAQLGGTSQTTSCSENVTGCGTIFAVSLTGAGVSNIHSFSYSDGGVPTSGLIQAKSGNLYGTTTQGGANGNYGTVFQLTLAGQFTTIYNFCAEANCVDGYQPSGPLVQGTDGNLYGTTLEGGVNSHGTVFKITPQGKLTTLYSFCALTNCADGAGPSGGLIQAADGDFYGTASNVFKITPTGKLTTLYSFTDGQAPLAGVIQATDGNFYGTTYGGGANSRGTIFKLTPTGKLTTLYSFCSQSNCDDGVYPMAGLLEDTSGNLDGAASAGGLYGFGTLYSISVGLSPFVKTSVGNGIVGTEVMIYGSNFVPATSVSFNGTPAAFTALSSTVISTAVPSGATTGYISVGGTADGTLKSNLAFKVTPQLKQFSPTSGPVGTQVTIGGVSLTQTASVTFGGVKATFTVDSDNQITATVPSTAKTGKVSITTSGGTVTSARNFTVTN